MQTFEHTTLFTAHTDRGLFAPASLRYGYTYAWTLFALGVYLYLYLGRGWCKVR